MHFRIPFAEMELSASSSVLWTADTIYEWGQIAPISYQTELRWSALCALIHEDVLELFFAPKRSDHDRKTRYVFRLRLSHKLIRC